MGNELGTIASPYFREMQLKSMVDVERLIDLHKHSYGFGLDPTETRAFLTQAGFSTRFIEAMHGAFTNVGPNRPEACFSSCDFLGVLIIMASSPREDTDFSDDAVAQAARGELDADAMAAELDEAASIAKQRLADAFAPKCASFVRLFDFGPRRPNDTDRVDAISRGDLAFGLQCTLRGFARVIWPNEVDTLLATGDDTLFRRIDAVVAKDGEALDAAREAKEKEEKEAKEAKEAAPVSRADRVRARQAERDREREAAAIRYCTRAEQHKTYDAAAVERFLLRVSGAHHGADVTLASVLGKLGVVPDPEELKRICRDLPAERARYNVAVADAVAANAARAAAAEAKLAESTKVATEDGHHVTTSASGHEATADGAEDSDHEGEMAKIRKMRQRGKRIGVSSASSSHAKDGEETYEKKYFEKTDAQVARIQAAVAHSFLFDNLTANQKKEIFDAMFEKKVDAGEVIIEQGDQDADNFYIVDSGEFDCYVEGVNDGKPVVHYEAGGGFGELALMYNAPRAATIKCCDSGPATVWAVDRDTFRHVVVNSRRTQKKKYEGMLKKIDILKHMTPTERSKLADALDAKSYHDGEVVIKEGDDNYADMHFYLIEAGVAVATQGADGTEVGVMTEGGYFGEKALIEHKPRAASVTAKGPLEVACLDCAAFERVMGPAAELMARHLADYRTAEEVKEAKAGGGDGGGESKDAEQKDAERAEEFTVLVQANEAGADASELLVKSAWSFSKLKKMAGKKAGIKKVDKLFLENGSEVADVGDIPDSGTAKVYVSTGGDAFYGGDAPAEEEAAPAARAEEFNVLVHANEAGAEGSELLVKSEWSFSKLKKMAGKKAGIKKVDKLFLEDGSEVADVGDIPDGGDGKIYVGTNGETFWGADAAPAEEAPDEPSEEDKAAAKLQALHRGNASRQELADKKKAATKLQALQRGRSQRAKAADGEDGGEDDEPPEPEVSAEEQLAYEAAMAAVQADHHEEQAEAAAEGGESEVAE